MEGYLVFFIVLENNYFFKGRDCWISMNKFFIYGFGHNAKKFAWNYVHNKFFNELEFVGFVDDAEKGEYLGFPILGDNKVFNNLKKRGINNVFVTLLKNPRRRLEKCLELENKGFKFPNFIQNNFSGEVNFKGVYIDETSKFLGVDFNLGDFSLIGPYSTIEGKSTLGKGAIVSPYSFVGYNSGIGDGSVLYPYAGIAPNKKIGKFCIIGPKVFQKQHLGDGKISKQ